MPNRVPPRRRWACRSRLFHLVQRLLRQSQGATRAAAFRQPSSCHRRRHGPESPISSWRCPGGRSGGHDAATSDRWDPARRVVCRCDVHDLGRHGSDPRLAPLFGYRLERARRDHLEAGGSTPKRRRPSRRGDQRLHDAGGSQYWRFRFLRRRGARPPPLDHWRFSNRASVRRILCYGRDQSPRRRRAGAPLLGECEIEGERATCDFRIDTQLLTASPP